MKLDMKHVFIWNTVSITLIVIGLLIKQDSVFAIGCIGMFAQMLPISLAALDKMFPDDIPQKESRT